MLSTKAITFDVSAVGPTEIIPPWNSNKIRVWSLFMWNLAEQTVDFCNNTGVTMTGYLASFPAKSGKLIPLGPKPYFELDTGSGLFLRTSGGTRVTGYAVLSAPSEDEKRREDHVTPSDISLTVTASGSGGMAPMAIDYAAFGAAVASAIQRQTDTLAEILLRGLGGR